MATYRKTRKALHPGRPERRATAVPPALAAALELLLTGRTAQAAERAATDLARTDLSAQERCLLLALRAEALDLVGEREAAQSESDALMAYAADLTTPAALATAWRVRSLLNHRRGRPDESLAAAHKACAYAERSADEILMAHCAMRRTHVRARLRVETDAALEETHRAVTTFQRHGLAAYQARALTRLAHPLLLAGRFKERQAVLREAIALSRSCGDLANLADALNLSNFTEVDMAAVLSGLRQALDAAHAAGDVRHEAILVGNLGSNYEILGLYRRARRALGQADAVARRAADDEQLFVNHFNLLSVELALRRISPSRALLEELTRLLEQPRFARYRAHIALLRGRLELLGKRSRAAARAFAAGAELDVAHRGVRIQCQAELGAALLADGRLREALAHTQHATDELGRAANAALDSMDPCAIWWRHAQALAANRRTAQSTAALRRAYRHLLKSIGGLGDEGLRRNAINKRDERREVVVAWLAHARGARLPRSQWTAHLAGGVDFGDSVARLVDAGLRLNELRSADELVDFLVDEATELSGAQRVLVVLDRAGELRIAGSLVPHEESDADVLRAITPWLEEARSTRAVRLRHGPEGVDAIDQRSCLVAPLVSQGELLGFLYCDMDGAFGRFGDNDRDLLAMLASQAATALANLRFSEGLERKVAERTAEVEQRASELALINSIQQGIAESLSFQAIVDLVGDKLREVLHIDTIGIRWYEQGRARRTSSTSSSAARA